MTKTLQPLVVVALVAALAASLFGAPQAPSKPVDRSRGFFPVSVWYSGGKARAPMLETVTPQSRDAWRKDLEQIRKLGFNTVRTWIEWTACEKQEGKYDFSALKLLADLAGEVGLRVIVQVYIDSAPDWVGSEHPDSKVVSSHGVAVEAQQQARRPVVGPHACIGVDHDHALLHLRDDEPVDLQLAVEFAAARPRQLLLAGHTHGGAIAFGIPGLFLLAPSNFETRYVSGAYQVGHMTVSVTNGLGFTLAPIRYHAPAEIVVVTLR